MSTPPSNPKLLEQTTPDDENNTHSSKSSIIQTYLIEPSFLMALTNLNLVIVYIAILMMLLGYSLSYYYLLIYIPILWLLSATRKSRKEKLRLDLTHRIPFFAEALANSLSAGSTLEQAFIQGAYFLKGRIKVEFINLILKNKLGKNLGVILREIDALFPNTGLMYLISLLDAYSELGVGISPLLKRISGVLANKEKAEDKIRSILSGGSSYAKLTIVIFGLIFLALSYLMQDQVMVLLQSDLRPVFAFLMGWTCIGIIIVSRITSLSFTKNFALRPYIDKYFHVRKLDLNGLLNYSGVNWTKTNKRMLFLTPMFVGIIGGYIFSWFFDDSLTILFGIAASAIVSWILIKYILKGLVEDQLVRAIEIFPDILQVFIIGLNSGLNVYLAFRFAFNAIQKGAPNMLVEELNRTQLAMECGEEPSKSWQLLAHRLPFETVIDFAEIMVVAPVHGDSIVDAITRMISSYQDKKILLLEKKAVAISQIVIPVIILAFFPLFLFVMFAPLISKIKLFMQI